MKERYIVPLPDLSILDNSIPSASILGNSILAEETPDSSSNSIL